MSRTCAHPTHAFHVCRAGKSSFDVQLPATYEVLSTAVNTSLVDNVAAGSHRLVGCSSAGPWLAATPTTQLVGLQEVGLQGDTN
jgi:hypothetical protein